jgi:hypothetical protein
MDQFAAGFAIDPATLGNVVHQAQKGDGNRESEKGGNVGVHEISSNIRLLVQSTR